MNRISGPAGLPHSCAEMVRPSGVFAVIGLYFKSSPKLGCAIATNKAEAAVVFFISWLSRTVVFIEILPLFFSWQDVQPSTCIGCEKVRLQCGRGRARRENRGHVP